MKLKRMLSVLIALLLCFTSETAALTAAVTAVPEDVSVTSSVSEDVSASSSEPEALTAVDSSVTDQYPSFTGTITAEGLADKEPAIKNGNIRFNYDSITIPEVYEAGDLIKVTFLDKELIVPYCSTISDVAVKKDILMKRNSALTLAINNGDFATEYGIATKDNNDVWTLCDNRDSIEFTFSMYQKAGYLDEYNVRHMTYTDNREDYPELTDEQFANFREIRTSGIIPGKLYRTASPIDSKHKRNRYADAAIKQAGVTVIMNLADTEATAKEHEGYAGSYYSGTNYMPLKTGMDPAADDTKQKIAKGFKFFADNPDGIYAIHCQEGKDRTGFACALVELLMGASLEEAAADYMITFCNYYKLKPGDERYNVVRRTVFEQALKSMFVVEDLSKADLAAEAAAYLKEGGMTDEDISKLKANLSRKANTLKVKGKRVIIKRSRLRKGNMNIKRKKVLSVSKAQGTVTYKKISGNKKIKVNKKTGALKINKKLRRGNYKVKVQVKAAGNDYYEPAKKTVTIKIRVK